MPNNFRRSEIVIGLVGALGTDLEVVERALTTGLLSVGYVNRTVRVSELLAAAYTELELDPLHPSDTKLDRLMDIGDAFRTRFGDGAIAARLAVSAISAARFEDLPPPLDSEDAQVRERSSTATTIRQLKHPDEVELLRSVYGPRFVLIGAWSPEPDRRRSVHTRLVEMHPHQADPSWYDYQASRLLRRDEKDSRHALGQRVRDTFELADAYVALRQGYSVDGEVARIVRLLFAAPFETPTPDEHAMYQAAGARLRSSASGRQVGAVVVDEHGEILVTGMNDVPKAGGGQYWTGDEPDYRDFRLGFDFNDHEQLSLITDTLIRLKDAGWLAKDQQDAEPSELAQQALQADGPFRRSRIGDLLEFGRILHAEMAAVCTAARRGTPIGGRTMYVTTFPCHECARLIIGSGIKKLVYVDPYPKSLVPTMYAHEISLTPGPAGTAVQFEPFEGIAPRLYQALFTMADRSRDSVSGAYYPWRPELASPRVVIEADLDTPIQNLEDAVTDLLYRGASVSESTALLSADPASMTEDTNDGHGGPA